MRSRPDTILHGLEITRVLADEPAIGRMLSRIAHEIVERNHGLSKVALVGIRTGGYHLAKRLQTLLTQIDGTKPPLGAIDITLYRDDAFLGLPRPEVGPTELSFALEGKIVVLVDDVLYTGRTIRAALDALMDYGRPQVVQLAVLVDRGWRELPIAANYTGITVATSQEESVKVFLRENPKSTEDQVAVRMRKNVPTKVTDLLGGAK